MGLVAKIKDYKFQSEVYDMHANFEFIVLEIILFKQIMIWIVVFSNVNDTSITLGSKRHTLIF